MSTRLILLSPLLVILALLLVVPLGAQARTVQLLGEPKVLTGTVTLVAKEAERDYSGRWLTSMGFRMSPAWVVWSDREDNGIYASPSRGSQVINTAGFLDWFVVGDIDGDFVHVYRVDPAREDLDDMEIDDYTDLGWIPTENLLLWNHCLVTRGGVNSKRLILNSVEEATNRTEELDFKVYEFRASPTGNGSATGHTANLFQYYFFWKQAGDHVLLGFDPKTRGAAAELDQSILGWVPRSKAIEWNTRIALEPNWRDNAAKQRRRGLDTKVFINAHKADRYRQGDRVGGDDIIWDNDTFTERPIGDWRRFPMIGKDRRFKNVYRVGAMGEIFLKSGDTVSSDSEAELRRKISTGIESQRYINVVFVVDGTLSMGPYLAAVHDALLGAVRQLRSSNNTIKFGGVVYRDFNERQRSKWLESIPLSQDGATVAEWFLPMEFHETNYTHTEAVYYGLEGALLGGGFVPEQENIIVLIGDAGNRQNEDRVDVGQLTQLIADYRASICAFQVHTGAQPAYTMFRDQIRSLIMDGARKHARSMSQFGSEAIDAEQISWQRSGNTERLQGAAIGGAITTPGSRSELAPEAITRDIVEFVSQVSTIVDGRVEIMKEITKGRGALIDLFDFEQEQGTMAESHPLKRGVIAALDRMGLDQEQLKLVKSNSFQLYIDSFAPITVKGQSEPLFQQVLFLDTEELMSLVNVMRKLRVTRGNNMRQLLYDVMVELVSAHVGESIDPGTLGMNEVRNMIFGLDSESEFFKDVELEDILEPKNFSKDDFNVWSARVYAAYEELENIYFQSDYDYRFSFNEVRYFWIDARILP